MKTETAEEANEPAEQVPTTSSTANNPAEESEENDQMPQLQPMLALPAPADWKPTEWRSSISEVVDENNHKYVGLLNQCQTCYLNSLVQTLYMCPEFRNTILRIEPKVNSKGIHHQLQRLFAQLQTSNKLSLATVDLTESFGWQNEQLYQHDVQELFRVLIEALEKRWEKTPHKGCVENLFEGKILDYVKCLNCGKMKSKPDIFLDLSLAIKADGQNKPYKSLEESMSAYIKPELLNGNNKYRCENCGTLEDAEKGLAIKEFPAILAIQLKRYDFDYNTLHRIKLNDRLTFPDYVDLNKYLYKEPQPKMSYAQAVSKPSTSSKPDSSEQSPPPNEKEKGWWPSMNWSNIAYLNPEDDSGWLNVNTEHENVQNMLQNGPHVYELFSVLIHQGSATGGHYFAYIKNLDQQKWFCFNDSSVSNATPDDVKRTFGGTQNLGFNSSNAYMLMYRRIEPTKNEAFVRTPELPEHVKRLLVQIERDEEEVALQRQLEKERVTVHVICNDRSTISENPLDLILHKDISYRELLRQLCSNYPTISEADVRLIKSNHNWEMLAEYNEESSELPLNEIHRSSSFRPEGYIMLDTKQGSHFYEIPPSGSCKTADVHLVDLDKKIVIPAKRVCFDMNMTCGDLKGHLCIIPEVRLSDPLRLRIVFDAYQDRNQPMILWNDDQVEIYKLARMIRGENLQLFIDIGSTQVLEQDRSAEKYEVSQMFAILERKKYSLRLVVWLPTQEDFSSVNLPVPDFQNLSVPIKSAAICEPVEEEAAKDLSADDTESSSSNGLGDADDCFVDGPGNERSSDYVPPDPFQVAKLNIDATNAELNTGCSLSASSTYSSTNSNAPTNFTANETEPLDPEQMEILVKTSSSAAEAQPGPPPPPYSENPLPSQRSSQGMTPPNPPDIQSISVQSPRDDMAHSSTEINDEDAVSMCSNTPKRSPTPNVSDDEDNTNSPKDAFEKKMSVDENTAAFVNSLQPNSAEEPELNMDLFAEEKHAPLIGTGELPDPSQIEVINKFFESDHMKVELNLDRRMSLASLHNWIAAFLNLNRPNIQIYKFYHEFGDGFSVNLNTMDPVQNSLSEIDHICVKLQNDESKYERATYIRGKDHGTTTSFRRERQLRIKLASESEP